uniref:Uncharacterized protein n=1 Tax=viral metagenome TaxID=1070528 RepID=A0A6H1ZWG6_9ZZZZ
MTIDEAIEILSQSANAGVTTFDWDYKDAQRLGIEALKRVRKYRPLYAGKYPHLLPGETKE